MKYPFAMDVCPLCGLDVKKVDSTSNPSWACISPMITFRCKWKGSSVTYDCNVHHYDIILDEMDQSMLQTMIVGPYWLSTDTNRSETQIEVYDKQIMNFLNIATVPQIKPDTYDKLMERVKKLVLLT